MYNADTKNLLDSFKGVVEAKDTLKISSLTQHKYSKLSIPYKLKLPNMKDKILVIFSFSPIISN